jgi:DNA polymerase-3 subunit delta
MQLAASQLPVHLAKGVRTLYMLHGDEPLLQQEAADAIRAAARSLGEIERSVHTVAGAHFDWSAVLAAGGSASLFADRQLLEINIPSGKPGKDGSAALQQIAAQATAQESTITLVLLPRLDRLTRQGAWFAALEGTGVSVQIDTIERQALPAWIAERLRRQGQQVAPGEEGQQTLQFFADRVEGNLLAAHQEIQKLALIHPPGVLSFDAVKIAVTHVARYDVSQLSEAVLGGQPSRTQSILDGLEAEGEAAVRVHWSLAEDIRSLKRVRDAMDDGRPLPMALREARVWGAKERLYERALGQLDRGFLAQLVGDAHRVDGIVKGLPQEGWPRDGWQALHRLAQSLARACQSGSPGSASLGRFEGR